VIVIVGLGPLDRSCISVGAYEVIRSAPTVFVRTARHPAVDDLAAEGIAFESLDYIYESAATFEEVYARIAARILEEAPERGDVVYAVPGHPLVGEASVRVLIEEARRKGLELRIVGSESFIEAALEALGLSLDPGLKILDALSVDQVCLDQDVGNLIYQVYSRDIASKVKLKLMERYADDFEVTVISGAGASERKVQTMPLYQLDRCHCDHLTSVYVPPAAPDHR